jgi:exodeoxyribonuclease-5
MSGTLQSEHALSDDQIVAMDLFEHWYHNESDPEFRLGGLAGTGKTSLVREIVRLLDGIEHEVITPTAKAAEVLSRKGIKAKTSHSLLCNFEYEVTGEKGRITPVFSDKGITRKVIVCDEASMVTSEMREKILACADRVVWVGDYGQLPPVEKGRRGLKGGVLNESNLDAKLTVQHRHGDALEIVKFAGFLRDGGNPQKYAPARLGISGPSQVTVNRTGVRGVKGVCEWAVGEGVFPLICYTNAMIARLNDKIRKVQGCDRSRVLYPGLKLKCFYNSYRHGVWNGELFEVAECGQMTGDIAHIVDTRGRKFPVTFSRENKSGAVRVEDGYAITCHNSQGSEWPKIAVIEEMLADACWRYTGATRAQNQVDYFTKGAV